MSLDLYLAYVVATVIVVAVPGPTIMLILSYALRVGRRSSAAMVLGVGLGDLVAITASLAGVGALLATSATAFSVLKWIGAGYLIWLGIRTWRAQPAGLPGDATTARGPAASPSRRAMTLHAFTVTALNPKSIAFFVAFLPQFVEPAAPLTGQLILLGATFLVLGLLNAAVYAVLAGALCAMIRRPGTVRWINRLGGGVLIGAGLMTAALKRP